MQAFRSSVSLFVFALLLALFLREPSHAAEIDPALVAAAKKEGRVVLYTPMIVDQIVRPLAASFRAKYGIEVQYLRLDSDAVVLKILNEYRARRARCRCVHHLARHRVADRRRRRSASSSRERRHDLPAQFKDPDGYWVANRLYVLGPAINTNLVPERFSQDLRRSARSEMDGQNRLAAEQSHRRHRLHRQRARHDGRREGDGVSAQARAPERDHGAASATAPCSIRWWPASIRWRFAMTNHNVEISRKEGAPVAWIPLEPAMVLLRTDGPDHALPASQCRQTVPRISRCRARGSTVFQKAGYIPTHPDVPPLEPKLLPAAGGFKGNVFTPAFVEKNRKHWDEVSSRRCSADARPSSCACRLRQARLEALLVEELFCRFGTSLFGIAQAQRVAFRVQIVGRLGHIHAGARRECIPWCSGSLPDSSVSSR